MSEVVVIDDALRDRITAEIAKMAREHPNSIAAQIKADCFELAVTGIAEVIDNESTDDFEIACIVAMAKWKKMNNHHFIKARIFPNRCALTAYPKAKT